MKRFTSVLISACLLTGLVGCSNSDDGMKATEENQIMETIEVVEMETIEVVEVIPSFPEDCQSQDVIDAMEASNFNTAIEEAVRNMTGSAYDQPRPRPYYYDIPPLCIPDFPQLERAGCSIGVNLECMGLDLSGFDFSVAPSWLLEGANFENAILVGASFKGLSLAFINFNDANLMYSNFSDTKLLEISFQGSDARFSDLTRSNLTSGNFEGSDFENSDFSSATWKSAIGFCKEEKGKPAVVTEGVFFGARIADTYMPRSVCDSW